MSDTTKTNVVNANEPYVDITSGEVTGGPLEDGQTFYWYNPNSNDVEITIGNCGTWCVDSSYTILANEQYAEAQILADPNANPLAWTDDPSAAWSGGGNGPYIVSQDDTGGTPLVNLQTGVVSLGQLQNGASFNWNNPSPGIVTISNCGTWCSQSSYTLNPHSALAATTAANMNTSGYAFTESPNRWDAGSLPHTQGPVHFPGKEHKHKEVA